MANHPKPNVRPGARDPWQRWGWLIPVFWLFFFYYPITGLLKSDAPPAAVILGWLMLAVFAVAYVLGFISGMRFGDTATGARLARVCLAAIVLGALLMIPALGWYVLSVAPFVMAYAGFGFGGWLHWVTTGVCVVAAVLFFVLHPDATGSGVLLFVVLLMAVVVSLMSWLIRKSFEREQTNIQLVASQERESIARDVHDLIGHSLTVIKLKSALASRLIETDPERARAEIAEIEALAGEAISGVRSTVTGLRTNDLDAQLGLSRDALRAANISLAVEGATSALSPAQALTASWVLREATTNVLRHSGASAVVVSFAPGTMSVRDNGGGIQGEAGNGLRGMTERASAAGAELTIADAVPHGTRVEVRW